MNNLSDEEKEIFNNLKDYMQNQIDNGYHKFIYNDLGWDFKCIDCINTINKVLKQSKEIEDYIENKELINQTLGLEKNANINKTLEKIIILNNFEDKIREKIKEYKKQIEELKDSQIFTQTEYEGGIKFGQSLLEGE